MAAVVGSRPLPNPVVAPVAVMSTKPTNEPKLLIELVQDAWLSIKKWRSGWTSVIMLTGPAPAVKVAIWLLLEFLGCGERHSKPARVASSAGLQRSRVTT